MKTASGVTRIAMWSGPRNISTALMRAWENRPDTNVVDEPFYACYLASSGRRHPGRDEILAAQPTDWRDVVAQLRAPLPAGGVPVFQLPRTVFRSWMPTNPSPLMSPARETE